MNASEILLSPSEAARKLGISSKALRLYERRGLLRPRRSAAGWRFYGDPEMARAGEVAALRRLGLSLSRIGAVLSGDRAGLDAALMQQQAVLNRQMEVLAASAAALARLRENLAGGGDVAAVKILLDPKPDLALDLPWPWAGERFELAQLAPVTYLTGPLGSGKTRLAQAMAETLSGARFSPLSRCDGDEAALRRQLSERPAMAAALDWLRDDGAGETVALLAVLTAIFDPSADAVVVDLIEAGLDEPSQDALGAWLRCYDDRSRPLIVMTRSTAILDLASTAPARIVIYCPANHGPPLVVRPHVGAAGYEAVVSCLASPDVRERTVGMVAVMAQDMRENSPG